jgi:hypothetical protein
MVERIIRARPDVHFGNRGKIVELMAKLSNVAAVLGCLLCLVSGISRLAGKYYLAGVGAFSVFLGGMALMLLACLIKLYRLENRP